MGRCDFRPFPAVARSRLSRILPRFWAGLCLRGSLAEVGPTEELDFLFKNLDLYIKLTASDFRPGDPALPGILNVISSFNLLYATFILCLLCCKSLKIDLKSSRGWDSCR